MTISVTLPVSYMSAPNSGSRKAQHRLSGPVTHEPPHPIQQPARQRKCSNCGAPQQSVGSSCEYCKRVVQ